MLEGAATLHAGGEEYVLEPGVFARVGPNETRKLVTGESPATILVLGGVPGQAVRGRRSSPTRASRTRWPRPGRRMADVTVKRVEEFEAIFGGGFRRVRAGLGVSSFGLAVMDLPPNFTDYPDHDQAHDHQEEVYTLLSGRATLRVGGEGGEEHELEPGSGSGSGPTRSARSSPATSRRGCWRSAAHRARAYEPPEFTVEGGSHLPIDKRPRARRAQAPRAAELAEEVVGRPARWSAGGARAVLVGPEALGAADQPRRLAASPSSRARSAAAASWSATAIAVAASSRPSASARPRQSSSGDDAGAADRDLRLAEAPRPAEAVGDHDRGAGAPPRAASSARIRRAEASASAGSRATVSVAGDVGGVDARVGADPAAVRSRRSAPPRVARTTRRDSARISSTSRGSRSSLARRVRRASAPGSTVARGRGSGPRPWRRPSARRRRSSPSASSSPVRGGRAGDQRRRARRPRRPPAARSRASDLEPAAHAGARRSARAARAPRRSRAPARAARASAAASAVRSSGVSRSSASDVERARSRPRSRRARRDRGGVRRCPRRTRGRSRRRGASSRPLVPVPWRSGITATRPAAIRPSARVELGRIEQRAVARQQRASTRRRAPGPGRSRASPPREWPRSSGSRSTSSGVVDALGAVERDPFGPPLAGDDDHPLDRARPRRPPRARRASIALTRSARCGRSRRSSRRCFASPKRFTGMIAVARMCG